MKHLLVTLFLLLTSLLFAQKEERQFIKKGNKQYTDSLYTEAEKSYLKAIDVNGKSSEGIYNLGNVFFKQAKMKEAMEQYQMVVGSEQDKLRLAHIHHNMGNVNMADKKYDKAVASYKSSLRNNPKDDETRYNLALAQKLLKDQQDKENKDKKDDKKEDKKDDKKEQEKKDKEKKEQEKKDQNKEDKKEQQQQPQNQMSKENAEQLLDAIMQDEKQVQDKVKKQQQQKAQSGRPAKDW